MPNLSILFKKKPLTWGLRGDEPLWNDLKEYYKTVTPPATAEDFRQTFFKAFKELTGRELQPFGTVYVEKYNHGGMSGGAIYCYLWYCRLLPELTERFLAYKHNPESPRIYSSRISYTQPTVEEKLLEEELMQKSNAVHHFKWSGIEEVKQHYPQCVEFVESIKHRNLEEVIIELSAQMASLG